MVEFPPYVKLVVNNAIRKETSIGKTESERLKKIVKVSDTTFKASVEKSEAPSSFASSGTKDIVELISNENRRALDSQPPTLWQAESSLRQLQRDLPTQGQAVGELHSKMDRRVILTLLAPLVL